MHSGHTGQHTKPPLACHHSSQFMGRVATCLLSWSIELTGQSRAGIWISSQPQKTNRNRQPSQKNGKRRRTTVPCFTKKEPKDGMITESSSNNSSKETRSYSSIQNSSYSVKENCEANGKDRTPSSTLCHTMRSPSKTMTVTYLKSTVNI